MVVVANVILLAAAAASIAILIAALLPDSTKKGSRRVLDAYLSTFEGGTFAKLADADLRAKLDAVKGRIGGAVFLDYDKNDGEVRRRLGLLHLSPEHIDSSAARRCATRCAPPR